MTLFQFAKESRHLFGNIKPRPSGSICEFSQKIKRATNAIVQATRTFETLAPVWSHTVAPFQINRQGNKRLTTGAKALHSEFRPVVPQEFFKFPLRSLFGSKAPFEFVKLPLIADHMHEGTARLRLCFPT